MSEMKIVVVRHGWNLIGRCETQDCGDIVLTGGAFIRYWGTTAGLGQLAKSGPTSHTLLDPVTDVRLYRESIVFTIDVEFNGWEVALDARAA